jgi:hypothetical protein
MLQRLTILFASIFFIAAGTTAAVAYDMQGPVHPEKSIRAHFERFLNDPDSTEYRFSDVYFCRGGTFDFLGNLNDTPSWMVEVGINTKNLFGGYAGYQWFLIVLGGWLGGHDPLVLKAIEENMQSHTLEHSCVRADAQGRVNSKFMFAPKLAPHDSSAK